MSDNIQMCELCDHVHDMLSGCDAIDRILKLKADINTIEGTLENIQDDNVAKEARIATLEAECRERGALEIDALGKISGLKAELGKQISLTQRICPHPAAWGKVCSQCNKELVIQGRANKEQSNE